MGTHTEKELDGTDSILHKIQQQDRFIHVPYHHFDSFIRVLQEAAVSKQVSSIKITLYRLAKESKVVKALIGAARNGKKLPWSSNYLPASMKLQTSTGLKRCKMPELKLFSEWKD